VSTRNIHGLRLSDRAKAALCSLEDTFSDAEDSAKASMTLAKTELTNANNQVDDLDIPARKLLGEEPYTFFNIPDASDNPDYEKELEKFGIFLINGLPVKQGTINNLSKVRSLARLTTFSAMETFLGKDLGSFTYVAFSGYTKLGQDVNLATGSPGGISLPLGTPASSSRTVYVDFFWLEFPNANLSTFIRLQNKKFSDLQISRAVGLNSSLPRSTTGSGLDAMNITVIDDRTVLTTLEEGLGFTSSDVRTLVEDRSLPSVDLTAEVSDTIQSINSILLNSSGVAEESPFTIFVSPALLVMGTIDPKRFTPNDEATALAAELDSTALTDAEESTAALVFGLVEAAWDSMGRIFKEYRTKVADEMNQMAVFASWYLNTVGFGEYNNSPLPGTLGSNATSPATEGRINDLLLEDARDDCKIDVLGFQLDDALRQTAKGIFDSKIILNETINILKLSILEVFPRLFDNFTDSREDSLSGSTSSVLAALD